MQSGPNYTFLQNIDSFPTTKRGSSNKLLTENSLTRLINRLIDVDGFIITDCLYEKDNPIIGNGGKHLSINRDIRIDDSMSEVIFRNDTFEFVIRGYYFSVPISEIKNLINNPISPYTETMGLFARIFIDNTNPSYPELVGQTSYEEGEDTTEDGPWTGVEFFVCPITNKITPDHPYLPYDPSTGAIQDLGTKYLYYDLMLLKYIINDPTKPNGLYIPFESLCKFDTQSQSLIDGGELKFNVSEEVVEG